MSKSDMTLSRRGLGKSALLAALVAGGASTASRAAEANPTKNLIFTASDPGHWAGKEATHVPVVKVGFHIGCNHPTSDQR
ncbi:MAG: hypothetical protein JWM33_3219 [Caulobacteraceae bacterium]|nr:hypothetical protein [Caulobacteraceae bacterium]